MTVRPYSKGDVTLVNWQLVISHENWKLTRFFSWEIKMKTKRQITLYFHERVWLKFSLGDHHVHQIWFLLASITTLGNMSINESIRFIVVISDPKELGLLHVTICPCTDMLIRGKLISPKKKLHVAKNYGELSVKYVNHFYIH